VENRKFVTALMAEKSRKSLKFEHFVPPITYGLRVTNLVTPQGKLSFNSIQE